MRESDLRNDSQQCAQKKDFAIDPFGPARLILAFVIYQFEAKEPTHWLESIKNLNSRLGIQTKVLITYHIQVSRVSAHFTWSSVLTVLIQFVYFFIP